MLTLASVIVLAAATPSARAARPTQIIGLSDNKPETFDDPRFDELGIGHARLIVPYDAALTEPARVSGWLDAARRKNLDVHVAFERRRGDQCPRAPCRLPSVDEYREAFAAFRHAYPDVRSFTPWNEANYPTQPTSEAPERAAEYYRVMTAACAGCTVVGAAVLGAGSSMTPWIERFKAALPSVPRLWALHNYSDLIEGGTRDLDALLAAVPGDVWLTETGGVVFLDDSEGRHVFAFDEGRARDATVSLFDVLSKRADRVKRAYIYHWQAEPANRFDSGLIRPNGTARPAYDVLRAALLGLPIPIRRGLARAEGLRPVGGTPGISLLKGKPVVNFGRTVVTTRYGLRLAVRCLGFERCRGRLEIRTDGRLWRGGFDLRANQRRSVLMQRRSGIRHPALPTRRSPVAVLARFGTQTTRGTALLRPSRHAGSSPQGRRRHRHVTAGRGRGKATGVMQPGRVLRDVGGPPTWH